MTNKVIAINKVGVACDLGMGEVRSFIVDEIKALEVVRALADGIDPESGEVFGGEFVYQRPDVIRAMLRRLKR